MFSRVQFFALLSRPDNHALPAVDIIAALFDLTPAEARIARGIAQGLSLEDLAVQLGVSVATVRSHLKRAFVKTSTSRQAELAALLSRFKG